MGKATQLDGPPWGTYVDEDVAYLRGQTGSMGSGLLGGWSFAGYGGSFVEAPRPQETEVRAEIARQLDASERRPDVSRPEEQHPTGAQSFHHAA